MKTNNDFYTSAPSYSKFVDNQVLTNDQLNNVIEHLNYQDRLSRVLLSGVGIVCGLRVSYDDIENSIHLSKGAAVTTGGNLLKKEEDTYTHYKEFNDSNAHYGRFTKGNNGTTIKLRELETGDKENASDVYSLKDFGESLPDMVVVLYLEFYTDEDEDCSPIDCNTQGKEIVHNLRALLVKEEDAKKLVKNDTILSDLQSDNENIVDRPFKRLFAERVVLNEGNTKSYQKFRNAYDVETGKLKNKINELSSLKLFDEESFSERNLVAGPSPKDKLDQIFSSGAHPQYLYDFYKDLVTAYNELIDLLKEDYTICCPDAGAFPKHVMLGKLSGDKERYRHRFYPSPAHHRPGIEEIRAAYLRLLLMIDNYKTKVPGGFTTEGDKETIRITPSRKDNARLGIRAVPFYYDLETQDNRAVFLEKWKEGDVELVPNYYGYKYPDYSNKKFDPLDYCLEDYDFYRIEGHVGGDVKQVQMKIQDLKKDHGLAFDVKPIAIGGKASEVTINYKKYRTYFEDLQLILDTCNEKLECTITSATQFLSAFSLEEPGKHANFYFSNTSIIKPKDYDIRKRKNKGHAVLANITDEKGTIGKRINKKISESDNKWSFLFAAKYDLPQIDNSFLEAIIADIPIRMMGYMKTAIDSQLKSIKNFSKENVETYILALNELCRRAKISKKQLAERLSNESQLDSTLYEQDLKSKPWISQYRNVLSQIISCCCIINELNELYNKVKKRKQKLFNKLVLKHFIKKHPGAEHKAGVPKGGTLVLLYYSKGEETNEGISSSDKEVAEALERLREAGILGNSKVLGEVAQGLRESGGLNLFGGSQIDTNHKVQEQFAGVLNVAEAAGIYTMNNSISNTARALVPAAGTSSSLTVLMDEAESKGLATRNVTKKEAENTLQAMDTLMKVSPGILGKETIRDIGSADPYWIDPFLTGRGYLPAFDEPNESQNIPHGTVIGDLCLPYICCSDIPATNFVFPEQLATLHLEKDHVCIGKDDVDNIPMNVMPANATVKVFIQKRELNNVIVSNQHGTWFNPNEVSSDDYGKAIRFEVNSQPVEPLLKIYRKPNPSFTYSDDISFRKENTEAVVIFENTTESDNDLNFRWDFEQTVEYENALKFKNVFRGLEPGQNYDFKVKLTASNGPCEATTTKTVSIDVPALEKPEKNQCYSREVLECWGLNNVRAVLESRGIGASDWSRDKTVSALLKSLRKTGGFKSEELTSDVLEKPERRRRLLSCLEIPFKEDASWSETGELIKKYQKEHCGAQQWPQIFKRVRGAVMGSGNNPLQGASIGMVGTSAGTTTDKEGKFVINDISAGQPLRVSAPGYETKEIPITEPEIGIELVENQEQTPNVGVDPKKVDDKALKTVLDKSRKVPVANPQDTGALTDVLHTTKRGNALSAEELSGLKKKTLTSVSKEKGIEYAANDTTKQVAANLIKKSAITTPRVAVNTDLTEKGELKSILKNRGLSDKTTQGKGKEELISELYVTKPGNALDMEETKMLKNDTLKKTLKEEGISHAANDTKDEMAVKLMDEAATRIPRVTANPQKMDSKELKGVIDFRNIPVIYSDKKTDLLNALNNTDLGANFTESELKMLKNDTLRKALDKKGISYAAGDTKDVLIDKLING